ncbi:UDP-N-acetylglucosamine 1-carboxyvinyltransferase [Sedimentibacter hydroxybenzoicus DSM 7310]|uniref:UDP-N-acetylglucosamine 1-carboxyvinyltransferase n=1 Tax=Sedimentibacter hydroxybenzoicus DSM 7310 TaxID=1123245 RepID=A0A974BJY5_SEDHY|nr:UDP-N-acetylglucosamine 1-carboxyvinyltransferase [Sedimentibacter hydroxybenzoicus]NYB74472.1 UDP-N-acetylglucosamine 1-carboxyvinyltransferase [Sedimentibacter hydroxybenzoicus DSM 7310]
MEKIIVRKSLGLNGNIRVDGSKNAILPILAATLLTDEECIIHDVPYLEDVQVMCKLLESLGANVEKTENTLKISVKNIKTCEAPYELISKMRASFLVMGPLLARCNSAKVYMPGGCAIGTRPIDLHLKGFKYLGAEVKSESGYVNAVTEKLTGNDIYLDFPSVGATENIIMAASLAVGETILENAAEEPEIVDLANFLNSMGANIIGAGTKTIRIKGVNKLHKTEHTIIPDRIEAGTYMVLAAATGGNVTIENVVSSHLQPVIAKLREAGAIVEEYDDKIKVVSNGNIKPVDIKTLPYPGFPTDMQAQFMAMLAIAEGTSIIHETIFENRFMHASELSRMGANVKIEGSSAILKGSSKLSGAKVKATDLRAGAALIIEGLIADGETEITEVYHIKRGYANIIEKLQNIGANIHYEE